MFSAHKHSMGGVYKHFNIGRGALANLSMYWSCPVLLTLVRLAFPHSDLH